MPTLGFPLPTRDMDVNQLAELMAKVIKELEWALANMDAKNIKANSITANEIKANTITADKMNVTELSAITANLGHITAGLIEAVQIYGSYIATSTGYPRTEMSTQDNLFAAYQNVNNGIRIEPSYFSGTPALTILSGGIVRGYIQDLGTNLVFLTVNGTKNIQISSGIDLFLNAEGDVQINAPGGVYANGIRLDVEPPPATP